ncbi:plasma membrane calcium-transporting atpase 2 [Stemphylium lycopersici]|uniref:Plasma membrane calcium-transporting atpase 2 n=1 Tax=Stemphylium lycopersici TaxID=183478 RepID=A0A364MS02_STELY|nr:plasma membrane calcium-transporting atpase 2 [Stemphylium lycopersici]RAR00948.1 plasma membrane calcium-transporting atpase 2 [Stemphylium lycopersici]
MQTARAIATECLIYTEGGLVMEGPDFRRLTEEQLDEILPRPQVLARSSPEGKRILAQRPKALGEIVAVTGDGTNDAPVLKAANVGFSMVSGTEVAKEASSIVLMDDNFSSIITALMWGRAVNDAVQKFLQFQITVNITAVVLAFVTAVYDSDMEPALKAVQLLWVNLIMDTFAALALATDSPSQKQITGQNIYKITVIFVLYFAGGEILGYDLSDPNKQLELDTVIFNSFVWMQIFNIFNNRRLDNKLNILIIFVGGKAFQIKCYGLGGKGIARVTYNLICYILHRNIKPGGIDGTQWAISIVTGFICIPWAVLIRYFPDEWFAAIAGVVGKPVVILYRWCCTGASNMRSSFTSRRRVDAAGKSERPYVNVWDHLAKAYDVPKSTLQTRLRGIQPRSETLSANRKLLPIEEQSLVQWILDLDRRGFPPHIIDVRRMADALLAARGQDPPPQPIGKKWVSRFVQSQPELQTKWSRRFNSQRADYEDPVAIAAWFKLVEETRQTYGVLDQDIYNFDETGFAMGVASTSKVVTSSNRVGRAVVVQPGNREWVTAIECVNASGWCLPPLVILSGKVHQNSWYNGLPLDWAIGVSDNGWTTNQLGVEWVKHFNQHTATRTAGVYRLLILDGHSSHATPEFDQYCAENKIITLCMPPHTSHLLQPLDVSCFSPPKRAYGREIEKLACQGVYHIDKIDFLTVYQQIRLTVFTQQNIQAGFKATGLVPPCPDRVLSFLTVARTPSPPQTATDNAAAQSTAQTETPHTVAELQQQVRYLQERLRRKSESPTSVAVRQLAKSAQLAMQSATILAEENKKLRAEVQRQRQKQSQQRQYIASGGVLQVQQAQQLAAEAERVVTEGSQSQGGERRQRAPPTCTKCHVQGHTRTSCKSI